MWMKSEERGSRGSLISYIGTETEDFSESKAWVSEQFGEEGVGCGGAERCPRICFRV